jgi:hypothetical protein
LIAHDAPLGQDHRPMSTVIPPVAAPEVGDKGLKKDALGFV